MNPLNNEELLYENKQLKCIIREYDKRISYLEEKIKNIVDNEYINSCIKCNKLCIIDDEKCDFNIFCDNHICSDCIKEFKKDVTNNNICKFNKCNKWFCSGCTKNKNNNYMLKCNNCLQIICIDHFLNDDNTCIKCTYSI
jgi:hypothetical protein